MLKRRKSYDECVSAKKRMEAPQNEITLSHIESRASTSNQDYLDIFVKFDADISSCKSVVNTFEEKGIEVKTSNKDTTRDKFPRYIAELDECWNSVMITGEKVDDYHPGAEDEDYKERRKFIVEKARTHKQLEPIPLIEYTEEENQTWRSVYEELIKLYPTHACQEHNRGLTILQENGIYGPEKIPQLRDVSEFLHKTTGFRIRPVIGLIQMRTILAGFAFRVFPATQYIRYSSKPKFSPETDVCHELLGHIPLLLDPVFAQFVHDLGLASLGASKAWIRKLGRCFWHTVEVGLCKEKGKLKAYGATILSSFGELQHCLSGNVKTKALNHAEIAKHKPILDKYQPCYFVAESFQSAKKDLESYCQSTPRSSVLRYNPRTESIDELNDTNSLLALASEIRDDLNSLCKGIEEVKKGAEANY